MSRVLHSWRGLWTRFVLKSRTLATFAARAGVLLDRAKHGSVLLENTAIGGDESTWTGQRWLTFSSLGQETLGNGVGRVGDGGCMSGHHLGIGEVFLCHILPFCHAAWGRFKLSYGPARETGVTFGVHDVLEVRHFVSMLQHLLLTWKKELRTVKVES